MIILFIIYFIFGGNLSASTASFEIWNRAFATREGLVGHQTACGHIIRPDDIFVALPSTGALGRRIEVRHGNKVIQTQVLDVGPWNIDDAYWEDNARPKAERGIREPELGEKPRNPAGIDLSDGLFYNLRANTLAILRLMSCCLSLRLATFVACCVSIKRAPLVSV